MMSVKSDLSTGTRISVIVVTYNSRIHITECLDSVLRELGPQDELIVVDNGSTDDTADIVRNGYPSARLIMNDNTGYAGGNSRCASAAQGEYLLFLNPDAILQAGAAPALLAPLERATDIGLTTPCIVYKDRPGVVNTCGL